MRRKNGQRLFQRRQSPCSREGRRGTRDWVPGWARPWTKTLWLLLSSPVGAEARLFLALTGHLWLSRSGRAVFCGHILAQTMTRPGLLLATAWWRRFLISALRCAGCGRQTPTAGTAAVGSDLRVSTSRRRNGEARVRPASVQDADVVGADARVNDNTLLTNSLKKREKKKSTMATLRRAGGPGADSLSGTLQPLHAHSLLGEGAAALPIFTSH